MILVIGDIGIDEYVTGNVDRISPEAPIPVMLAKKAGHQLGMAANVVQQVASLGEDVELFGIYGKDRAGEILIKMLNDAQIATDNLIQDVRPTTNKCRFMSNGQQLLRVDYEQTHPISDKIAQELFLNISKKIKSSKAIILSDYGKGCLSNTLLTCIINYANSQSVPVIVDPYRTRNLKDYSDATILKPNFLEGKQLTGKIRPNEIVTKIKEETNCKEVVLTLGQHGMFALDKIFKTNAREIFDVTGAGDVVGAMLAVAFANGIGLEKACQLSNLAASEAVKVLGCHPVEFNWKEHV